MAIPATGSIHSSLDLNQLAPHITEAKKFQTVVEKMSTHPEICMLKSWKLYGKELSCSIIQSLGKEDKISDILKSYLLGNGRKNFEPFRQKAFENGFNLDTIFAKIDADPSFKPSEKKSKESKSFMDTFGARMNRYEKKHKEEEISDKSSSKNWSEKHKEYAAKLETLEKWHNSLNPQDPNTRDERMLVWVLYVGTFQEVDRLAKSDGVYSEFRALKKPKVLKPLIANWRKLYSNPDAVKKLYLEGNKKALIAADVTKDAFELFQSQGVTNQHVLKKLMAATVKGIKSEDKPKKP